LTGLAKRWKKRGPPALSNLELLAVLLGSGIKGKDVFELAAEILKGMENNEGFINLKTLKSISGVGDTFEIIEEQLPEYIGNLDSLSELDDFTFIKECYPDGTLKDDLSEREREHLLITFRAHSYRGFIDALKETQSGNNLQKGDVF
jgi:DNA repair protein RadC